MVKIGEKLRYMIKELNILLKISKGKTFYIENYDKLIKKLGMKIGIFEKYVLVEFGKYQGKTTVTIIGEN